jgi:hypothetical protein
MSYADFAATEGTRRAARLARYVADAERSASAAERHAANAAAEFGRSINPACQHWNGIAQGSAALAREAATACALTDDCVEAAGLAVKAGYHATLAELALDKLERI